MVSVDDTPGYHIGIVIYYFRGIRGKIPAKKYDKTTRPWHGFFLL
jgi:hypothetical protein